MRKAASTTKQLQSTLELKTGQHNCHFFTSSTATNNVVEQKKKKKEEFYFATTNQILVRHRGWKMAVKIWVLGFSEI